MVSEWPCDGDTADLHVLYAGQYLHMTLYGQTRLPPIHTAPPTYIDEKIGRRYLTTPCCRQVVQLFLCCSYTPPTDLDIPWLAHHTPARPPARRRRPLEGQSIVQRARIFAPAPPSRQVQGQADPLHSTTRNALHVPVYAPARFSTTTSSIAHSRAILECRNSSSPVPRLLVFSARRDHDH
jgi:hypothetical protein